MNVWQYLRQNWLSNRVFDSCEDILDAGCEACRSIITAGDMTGRLRPAVTLRPFKLRMSILRNRGKAATLNRGGFQYPAKLWGQRAIHG